MHIMICLENLGKHSLRAYAKNKFLDLFILFENIWDPSHIFLNRFRMHLSILKKFVPYGTNLVRCPENSKTLSAIA